MIARLARPWAATVIGGIAAGWYGLTVAPSALGSAMVWPASAVGFTAVVLWGPWMLPAVWLAAALVVMISGQHASLAIVLALPAVAEAALAWGLARGLRLELRFLTTSSILRLAVVAGAAAAVGAGVGVGVRLLTGMPPSHATSLYLPWLLGDATGMIAFAPALLAWLQPQGEPVRPGVPERLALTIAVALVSVFVLVNFSFASEPRTVPTLLALFPVVVWTSLRADTRMASLVVVVLSVAGTLGVRLHTGALTSISDAREVLNVQSFHFLLVVLTLVGTALTTQREQALANALDVERRLSAVSAATIDVQMLFAVEAREEFRLVHLNRAALELVQVLWPGAGESDLVGRYPADASLVLPGMGGTFLERNLSFGREAVRTRAVVRFQDAIQTPGGTRTADVTMVPITGRSGDVAYVLRSSVDTSARRAAEEAARRFNEDLERRVVERTHQLAYVNRELEAFGYTLSHDLRAPLRIVEGFSHAIIEDLEQGVVGDVAEHARRIHAASQRMHRLVDDLLRLSQVPTSTVSREVIDLTALAGDLVAELRATDPDRAVELRIHAGLQAYADARLLSIAMQNLLSNAWKYTARAPVATIEVGQHQEEGVTVTWVRDNGVGFDPQFATRLFAPFERLHKADDFEGVGIGLATVQRIIAAHGGRVWANAAPGHGAVFSFTLSHAPERSVA